MLVFPLRNTLMFTPQLFENTTLWNEQTQCFADCDIKASTTTDGQITAYSTDEVYAWTVNNSEAVDVHNYVLQYLEEGAIELVCLVTDLDMDHCDEIRAHHSLQRGHVSDCWTHAYRNMFGAESSYYDPDVNQASTSFDITYNMRCCLFVLLVYSMYFLN